MWRCGYGVKTMAPSTELFNQNIPQSRAEAWIKFVVVLSVSVWGFFCFLVCLFSFALVLFLSVYCVWLLTVVVLFVSFSLFVFFFLFLSFI